MKYKKVVLGAASLSLITSLLFTSGVSANTFETNQYTTNRDIQKSTTSSLQSVIQTEVTYKQNIDINNIHEYYFMYAGGQFTISKQHSDTEEIYETITNVNTGDVIEYEYSKPFNLPGGHYIIEVQGVNENPQGYEYKISGTFTEQPSNQLPSLSLSKPASHDVRLTKGSTRLDITGTTNADELDLYLNFDDPISMGASFNRSLTVQPGYNAIALNALSSDTQNAIWSFYNVLAPGVKRIGGKDRYEVSTGISNELEKQSGSTDTIIITRGDLYTDALSGGPLAALEGAPVLLTGTNSLPNTTLYEIIRRSPERAIILGGTGSVSINVENQLRSNGIETIQRIGGKDRYAVSAAVAEQIADYSDTAIIASGLNFPDALSASGMAGYTGMPILLVGTNTVPDSIQTFITNHPEIENFIIVGGPATVSDSVKTKIMQLRSGAAVDRIGGLNRYQVSINAANYGIENYGMDLSTLVFARGDVFADALSGSPLASFMGAPILLTTSAKLEGNVYNYLQQNRGKTDFMYILGGTSSITTTTEQQLFNIIK
ncbi:cell wall-binding repeat-containing protein [Fictibacillus sp. 26RED30]|uniref:cell wall-binding repeat-containing protein n=1 Tax=Fictibacillus sp. 26RED30 TaxID=2745877 RepID=UPI0018CF3F5B|nr:cell wall-binding repeat-containing protein [Fictibacillus sp. 26RED30]MBH0161724.1 cell wall-binding repeat-containing protein [Fictibacillus sp. 26RED30]